MTREERIKKMEELSTKENIIRMFQQNPQVVDDHCSEKKYKRITGLVEFMDPKKDLAPCFDSRYYCLNRCYISPEDNELHLSQYSIGAVLWGPYPDPHQLKKYNDEMWMFEGRKIKCIHLADETQVFPAN